MSSTQRDELLAAELAVRLGIETLDGLGALSQRRADEVADKAIEVGVLSPRFPFKQAEDLLGYLPLHRIEGIFAGQALTKDKVSADTLRERLTFHERRVARVALIGPGWVRLFAVDL